MPDRAAINRCRLLMPHAVIVALALWTAWRPAETVTVTGPLIALIGLGMTPWAWRRSRPDRVGSWIAGLGVLALYLVATGLAGWDVAMLANEVLLLAALLTVAWIASRTNPPEWSRGVVAFGIALLTLWAVWQVAFGFEQALAAVGELPPALRDNAIVRLQYKRAFASLPLPGHFAVLLATALPLLVASTGHGLARPLRAAGVGLCLVGLLLTRSPVGAALAVAACAVILLRRRRFAVLWLVAGLALMIAVLLLRAHLVEAGLGALRVGDSVSLRLDNWRTALWAWSTSPVTGVGVGGFGQAAAAVPFAVGNRPAHAHCLPLEWTAEMGLVGLALVGCCGLALWRLLRRLWASEPALAVALAVVPVHNLVDFSLYVSGVALPWAVLLGWGVARVRAAPETRHEDLRGRVLLVGCAALAVAVTVLHATSATVEWAAAGEDDLERRWQGALAAHRLAPWRPSPPQLVAATALDSGQPSKLAIASEDLASSRWLRPRSATLSHLRAQLAEARGEMPVAVMEAWRARSVRPLDGDRAEALDRLLARLERSRRASDS